MVRQTERKDKIYKKLKGFSHHMC